MMTHGLRCETAGKVNPLMAAMGPIVAGVVGAADVAGALLRQPEVEGERATVHRLNKRRNFGQVAWKPLRVFHFTTTTANLQDCSSG